MTRAAALCALLALGGCAAPTLDVQPSCLPMKAYTAQQQAQLAKEWAALDPSSMTASQFIPDSISLRDANRACMNNAPKP